MSKCNKCYKDDCSGQCEMDRFFKGNTTNDILYYNNGYSSSEIHNDLETIEKLALDLPDVDYILDNIVHYMFTNELTTDTKEDREKLYSFLYSINFNGQRNIDVLKGVAKGYRKYGYYGLLSTENGLVGVHPTNIIASIIPYKDKPVLNQTFTYLIAKDTSYRGIGGELTQIYGHNKYKQQQNYSPEEISKIIANPEKYEDEVIVVTDDEFACIKLDTSQVFGSSPLLKDRKRIQLILNILDRMNYDLVRNGIGTIALKAKVNLMDEFEETEESGILPGSGQLMDMGRSAKEERDKKVAEDMQAISDKLAETSYNDALVYSSRFSDLKQLTRDTKAIDFLDYLSLYIPSIISQMFGVPARLFDLGKTVSNIGTHSIIDNAMRNNIIPMREQFLGQCNNVLQKSIGIDNYISFSSYEFTRDYNYTNDLKIIEVYEKLKKIDEDRADAYLKKNLII